MGGRYILMEGPPEPLKLDLLDPQTWNAGPAVSSASGCEGSKLRSIQVISVTLHHRYIQISTHVGEMIKRN